eukprot:jgi/Bigna1/141188/aug1.61_g15896
MSASPWTVGRLIEILMECGATAEQGELAIGICGIEPGVGSLQEALQTAGGFLQSQGVNLRPPNNTGTANNGPSTSGSIEIESPPIAPDGKIPMYSGFSNVQLFVFGSILDSERGLAWEQIEFEASEWPSYTSATTSANLPPLSLEKEPIPLDIQAKLKNIHPSKWPITIPVGDAVPPIPGIACPKNCKLFPSIIVREGKTILNCDLCGVGLSAGHRTLSCRETDFDVCQNCALRKVNEVKSAKAAWMQEKSYPKGYEEKRRLEERNRRLKAMQRFEAFQKMQSKVSHNIHTQFMGEKDFVSLQTAKAVAHLQNAYKDEEGYKNDAYRGLKGLEMVIEDESEEFKGGGGGGGGDANELKSEYIKTRKDSKQHSGSIDEQSEGCRTSLGIYGQEINTNSQSNDTKKNNGKKSDYEPPASVGGHDGGISVRNNNSNNEANYGVTTAFGVGVPTNDDPTTLMTSKATKPAGHEPAKEQKQPVVNDDDAADNNIGNGCCGESKELGVVKEQSSSAVTNSSKASSTTNNVYGTNDGIVRIDDANTYEYGIEKDPDDIMYGESKPLVDDAHTDGVSSKVYAKGSNHGCDDGAVVEGNNTANLDHSNDESKSDYGKTQQLNLGNVHTSAAAAAVVASTTVVVPQKIDVWKLGMMKKATLKGETFALPLDALPNRSIHQWTDQHITKIVEYCSVQNARTFLKREKGKKSAAEQEDDNNAENAGLEDSTMIMEYEFPNFLDNTSVSGIREKKGEKYFGRKIQLIPSRPVNDQFQKIREDLTTNTAGDLHKVERQRELENYIVDFMVPLLGKVVAEYHLPPPIREYPFPVRAGGLAGGEKFLINGTLVKFAVDSNGVFGSSHEDAAKVALNEIRHLETLHECGSANVFLPFSFACKGFGFTLMISAITPIQGDESIVYGSADAAKTVHNKSKAFEHLVENLAKELNLASHPVAPSSSSSAAAKSASSDNNDAKDPEKKKERDTTKSAPTELWLAADIEGHQSKVDGRFYLIDLARLFPCHPPRKNGDSDHLVRLFRPEYMRHFCQKPISADVFSRFGEVGREEFWLEAHRAFTHLITEIVPMACEEMIRVATKRLDEGVDFKMRAKELVDIMHSHGINVRLMGHVYAYLHAVWKSGGGGGGSDSGRSSTNMMPAAGAAAEEGGRSSEEKRQDLGQREVISSILCNVLVMEMVLRVIKGISRRCFRNSGKILSRFLFDDEFQKWRKCVQSYKARNKDCRRPMLIDIAKDPKNGYSAKDHPKDAIAEYHRLHEVERYFMIALLTRYVFGKGPTADGFWKSCVYQGILTKFDVGRRNNNSKKKKKKKKKKKNLLEKGGRN